MFTGLSALCGWMYSQTSGCAGYKNLSEICEHQLSEDNSIISVSAEFYGRGNVSSPLGWGSHCQPMESQEMCTHAWHCNALGIKESAEQRVRDASGKKQSRCVDAFTHRQCRTARCETSVSSASSVFIHLDTSGNPQSDSDLQQRRSVQLKLVTSYSLLSSRLGRLYIYDRADKYMCITCHRRQMLAGLELTLAVKCRLSHSDRCCWMVTGSYALVSRGVGSPGRGSAGTRVGKNISFMLVMEDSITLGNAVIKLIVRCVEFHRCTWMRDITVVLAE